MIDGLHTIKELGNVQEEKVIKYVAIVWEIYYLSIKMEGQIDFKFMMGLFLFFAKYYDILCLLWAKAHRGSKQKMNSTEKVNFWNLQFQLPQMTYFVCSTPCSKSYKILYFVHS